MEQSLRVSPPGTGKRMEQSVTFQLRRVRCHEHFCNWHKQNVRYRKTNSTEKNLSRNPAQMLIECRAICMQMRPYSLVDGCKRNTTPITATRSSSCSTTRRARLVAICAAITLLCDLMPVDSHVNDLTQELGIDSRLVFLYSPVLLKAIWRSIQCLKYLNPERTECWQATRPCGRDFYYIDMKSLKRVSAERILEFGPSNSLAGCPIAGGDCNTLVKQESIGSLRRIALRLDFRAVGESRSLSSGSLDDLKVRMVKTSSSLLATVILKK